MMVSNIGIARILSDHFGKTDTEIMSYLITNTADTINDKEIHKLIRKRANAKYDKIIEAIKGYTIQTDLAKKR